MRNKIFTLKCKKNINYKIGESNLTVEKLDCNHFNQVIQVNVINNGIH